MRITSKCFAVALSVLMAAPVGLPASAMPMGAAKVETTANNLNVQRVQSGDRPLWWHNRNRMNRETRREMRREMRGERRWRERDRARWRDRDRWDNRRGYYRGHRGYRYARPGYRYHNGFWFPLAAFGAGAIIGGAIANDRGYVGGGSHVNWCANRYRSYRAYDNTFQPYNGPRRQCVSPYS